MVRLPHLDIVDSYGSQRSIEAEVKDRLERLMCNMVSDSKSTAQEAFATDWIAAYLHRLTVTVPETFIEK